MSLRQKYVKIFSEIFPAGAMGVSLLLGSRRARLTPTSIRRARNRRLPKSPAFPNVWLLFAMQSPTSRPLQSRPTARAARLGELVAQRRVARTRLAQWGMAAGARRLAQWRVAQLVAELVAKLVGRSKLVVSSVSQFDRDEPLL